MKVESGSLEEKTGEVRTTLLQIIYQQPFSHLMLLSTQLSSGLRGGPAPALCALTAEALGAETMPALAGAQAVLLVETMAEVLHQLGTSPEHGRGLLLETWGMPRTLNAADACFVLAHQRLLSLQDSLIAPESLAAAVELLEQTCGRISELLPESMADPGPNWDVQLQDVLSKSAVELAALLAGHDTVASEKSADAFGLGSGDFNRSLEQLKVDETTRTRLVAAIRSAGLWGVA